MIIKKNCNIDIVLINIVNNTIECSPKSIYKI